MAAADLATKDWLFNSSMGLPQLGMSSILDFYDFIHPFVSDFFAAH
jgi:hypothetical protein